MAEAIYNSGRPLKEFQAQNPVEIFPNAQKLPQFFSTNLVDDSRVVKAFLDDPQANTRVFYYQYLKLCFEFDNKNCEQYIDKVRQLALNPDFTFHFPSGNNNELFNTLQFKRLLLEFFDYMSPGGFTTNQALARFPIMDLVMVYFFKSLLILTGKANSFDQYIDRDSLFTFLTDYFGIEATVHDSCMKFVDTDIFAYEENPNQVYMIYIDYDKGVPLTIVPNQLPEMPSNAQSREEISASEGISQIQEQSSILNSKNQGRYSGANQENQKNPPMDKKKKEILTYMGTSDFYDFEDYTNPKTNSPLELGANANIQTQVISGQVQREVPERMTPIKQTKQPAAKFFSSNNEQQSIQRKEEPHQSALNNFSGTFNGNSNQNSGFVSIREESVQSSTQKSKEFLSNDKYGLDSVKVDMGKIVGTDAGSRGNQVGQSSFTSSVTSSYTQNVNYNVSGFTHESFDEKMKRITNKTLGPDHNRYPPTTSITNQAYVSQPAQGSHQKGQNRTVNLETGIQRGKNDYDAGPSNSYMIHRNTAISSNQEFTDSFTLEKVQEPHRSNIRSIKTRARSQRKPVGPGMRP